MQLSHDGCFTIAVTAVKEHGFWVYLRQILVYTGHDSNDTQNSSSKSGIFVAFGIFEIVEFNCYI